MESQNEWAAFLSKFGAAIGTALVATIAKISNEILMKRKLSWLQWFAIIGITLFWAWMAGLLTVYLEFGAVQSSLIIGLATLMGEKINIYLIQNYKAIFEKIIHVLSPKK